MVRVRASSMLQTLKHLGSLMATTMFVYTIVKSLFPPPLRARLNHYTHKFTKFLYPYIRITFHEYTGERLMKSEAYTSIQTYLSEHSSQRATRLKAEMVKVKDSHTPFVLSMADNEEIIDEFQGVKVWWSSHKISQKPQPFSISDEKRYYKLTFHKSYRDIITSSYLKHVLEEAKVIEMKNRQLKLYTNDKKKWKDVIFEHPATFETLALKPKMKEDIINDLVRFKRGKSYYAKIGKAWKRGYLLYGPPGTGKSTMIAAMANFMNYDVYDLELTSVRDNSDLRKLLINTKSKSIIVVEDIDCSLDLTGQRKKKKERFEGKEGKDYVKRGGEVEDKDSKVTLSGLLNVIDGIWSACGGERIMIFTTNFVEKLDHALIRRGRMDKHIELSYCCYEAFKVLAKNYLDIVESHHLFPRIEKLLEETKITPADVSENLILNSENEEVDTCLQNLIQVLEKLKEEDAKKAGEDGVEMKVEKRKQSNLKENKVSEKHGEGVKDSGEIHYLLV